MRRALLVLLTAPLLVAQTLTQRGFFQTSNFGYFQKTAQDGGLAVNEELLRYEAKWKPRPWIQLNAGLDARVDTHHQFERSWRLDFLDRHSQRPSFSARQYSVLLHKGGLSVEVGRQFIRWGKTDILNPTDRFAPKDFLNVANTEFLGVVGARVTYESGGETIDAILQPWFTPARTPLIDQRWSGLPPEAYRLNLVDGGSRIPGGGSGGVRWSHLGKGYEFSLSFYNGYNYLPLIEAIPVLAPPEPSVYLQRYYAKIRAYGGDVAVPLRWFTVKGEAAYFTSSTPQADEYALYVIQLERQQGEWTFIGGYAGEAVTRRRASLDFAPDRGLTKTLQGRASYNIDANRSVAFEAVVKQNGAGGFGRVEYSQAFGSHWRLTAAGVFLGGREEDFFGQYSRNNNAQLTLRYSF